MFSAGALLNFWRSYRVQNVCNAYCTVYHKKSRFQQKNLADDNKLTIDPDEEITPEKLKEISLSDGWADTFGSLTGSSNRSNVDEIILEDDEFEKPYKRLDSENRKHEQDWYGKKIEMLGKQGKVYEAIQVLEKEMLVDDRVFPNAYVYSALIGIVGRVGYTKKAFQLFGKMKNFGIKPDGPTYTALFNSCSNSPSRKDGLDRAKGLRVLMKEQDVSSNIITYQAMIKAFSRQGDIQTAFSIVDEVIENKLTLQPETFSFLLMACITDKEAGFTLCVKIWRLMRRKNVKFNSYHYNLLLRCTRDCSVGNEKTFNELLYKIPVGPDSRNVTLNKILKHKPHGFVERGERGGRDVVDTSSLENLNFGESSVDEGNNNLVEFTEQTDQQALVAGSSLPKKFYFPNILNPDFCLNSFHRKIEVSLPTCPSDRLLILGGVEGILSHFKKDGCEPSLKTFSLLLDLVPDSPADENNLLELVKEYSIKPDVTFFNILIKKRSVRSDYLGATQVLDLIGQNGLSPDEKTFGCLGMACSTEERGMKLLNDILKMKRVPNVEICDILIHESHMNFMYKLQVIKFMRNHQIRPNRNLLENLERQVRQAKHMILMAEKGEEVDEYYKSEAFLGRFRKFMMNFKPWLMAMELEPEVHPWAPYDQPTPEVPADS